MTPPVSTKGEVTYRGVHKIRGIMLRNIPFLSFYSRIIHTHHTNMYTLHIYISWIQVYIYIYIHICLYQWITMWFADNFDQHFILEYSLYIIDIYIYITSYIYKLYVYTYNCSISIVRILLVWSNYLYIVSGFEPMTLNSWALDGRIG